MTGMFARIATLCPSLSQPRRALRTCAGLLCALLAGACDDQDAMNQIEERVFDGHFEYRCVQPSDAFTPCGEENALPETIAVGAEFELRFFDGEGEEKPVVSASKQKLSPIGKQRFKVLDSGAMAVLALGQNASDDRHALDYLHINAKTVERLGLRDVTGDEDLSSLRLLMGQARTLIARPYAAGTKQITAGALSYHWDTSDPEVVTMEVLPNSRKIALVARKAGTCIITVMQGDVERSIDVTVVHQVPPKRSN